MKNDLIVAVSVALIVHPLLSTASAVVVERKNCVKKCDIVWLDNIATVLTKNTFIHTTYTKWNTHIQIQNTNKANNKNNRQQHQKSDL